MGAVPSVYPILRNARFYTDQRITSRAGMDTKITSVPFADMNVHSIRRLNDKLANAFDRIVGAGSSLYLASNPSAAIDNGYSGNPLSLIPFRPEQSPRPWMYVGDANKMRKVLVDGTNYQIGIAPPLYPPNIEFGVPAVNVIDDFNTVGSWVNAGTAGGLSVVPRAVFFLTGLGVVPDSTGNQATSGGPFGPGWVNAPIGSANLNNIRAGTRLILTQTPSPQETVTVQEVLPPSLGSYTTSIPIEGITYDIGTSGPCTITLVIPPTIARANLGYVPETDDEAAPDTTAYRYATTNPVGLRPNAILEIASTEFVRVVSVSLGQNGLASFRCTTAGTYAPGDLVSSIASARFYVANTYNSGLHSVTLTANALQSTVTQGIGLIQETTPLNLGIFGSQALPIQEDDIIHISLLMDDISTLVEFRLIFDVDPSTPDFQHNYFFKSWAASDIQQALAGNATMQNARQTSYSSQVVNTNIGNLAGVKSSGPVVKLLPYAARDPAQAALQPGSNVPTSTKMNPSGLATWLELTCKVSDLTKVGSDASATLAGVQGVRVYLNVSQLQSCSISALYLTGAYGPDIGTTGAPYLYRYRGRSSSTGAKSLASPATRAGIEPHRQSVEVDMTQHPDPQVDLLDVFRWGGTLPQWLYVGSTQNSSIPIFQDFEADSDIVSNPVLDTDLFQPFPTIDTPKSGVCSVVGTTVKWVSGDQFNSRWYPGSEIVLNGLVCNLYAQAPSATMLEIVQNAGTQTNIPFQITQATILAQPMPASWGPYQQGTGLFCFACGDTYQPGILFLTNGNDPDSASDVLQIEITTPSEPLMNGCMYNGQSYVWSSDRCFSLYPSFGSGIIIEAGTVLPSQGTNLFVPLEIPNGKGLFAQFCLAVGSKMWFRARDGIYQTIGGEPKNITGEELGLLFPHDNTPGQPVTIGTFTIYPPDDTMPNLQKLSSYNSFLYFDYQDTQGTKTTLVYSEVTGAWTKDDYTPNVMCHYGEEGQGVNDMLLGTIDGNIYMASGDLDGDGNAFPFEARMPQMSELTGGFQHVRDGYLGLMDSTDASLVINADGVDSTVALPSTAGVYKKFYTPLPPLKAQLFAFGILGVSPFDGIFQRDNEFRAKTWGDPKYSKINPFSSLSRAAAPKVA